MNDVTKLSFKQIQKKLAEIGISKFAFDYLLAKLRKRYKRFIPGYATPEDITKLLIVNSFDFTQAEQVNVVNRAAFLVCSQFVNQEYSWYWLNKDLEKDLALTNCPLSIPDKICLPNQGLILTPKKSSIQTSSGNFLLLAYKIFEPFEEIIINAQQTGQNQPETLKILFETPENAYRFAWFGCEDGISLNGGLFGLIPEKGELKLFSKDLERIINPQGQDKETSQMLSLLLNCLVYANPQNTDDPQKSQSLGFGKQIQSSFQQPLWIGKSYQRARSSTTDETSTTHASPVVHWRRGHWKKVAFGKGREQRKWVWIKPTLVGINQKSES